MAAGSEQHFLVFRDGDEQPGTCCTAHRGIIEFEWRHMQPAGNSGLFIWADGLPVTGSSFSRGIEIQVLDPGFNIPGKNEWYTVHGDIFAVNGAALTVAGRISPNGKRSFPTEDRTKSSPEWNHYRVVANNGDISLSVNDKVVTTAKAASPRRTRSGAKVPRRASASGTQ